MTGVAFCVNAAACDTDIPSACADCANPVMPARWPIISTRNACAPVAQPEKVGPRSGMNRDAVRIATSDAAAARTGAGTAPTTSTRDSRPCTAPRANSFRPLPEFRTTESIAPPSRSMSPRRLSVSAAAICCAVPNVEIWSM